MDWIDVNDKMPPPKHSIVIVCFERDGRLFSTYCLWEEKSGKYRGVKWGFRSRGLVQRKNIRYWMPIPNPPAS